MRCPLLRARKAKNGVFEAKVHCLESSFFDIKCFEKTPRFTTRSCDGVGTRKNFAARLCPERAGIGPEGKQVSGEVSRKSWNRAGREAGERRSVPKELRSKRKGSVQVISILYRKRGRSQERNHRPINFYRGCSKKCGKQRLRILTPALSLRCSRTFPCTLRARLDLLAVLCPSYRHALILR
ncbi:hypothetical protein SAMN05421736_101924 [Evansella caseinilytica]|uniref:Uncharacterized protein n=1 Tax=Evansella caseinilytica TaxID=1503961 RepID=A0A1H3ITI3_9BACI|nr:hypothetical protein SAMN05421736_101924 [Evansella caseinilytica]